MEELLISHRVKVFAKEPFYEKKQLNKLLQTEITTRQHQNQLCPGSHMTEPLPLSADQI